NDNRIPFWYRQNILFFSKRHSSRSVFPHSIALDACFMPVDLVHPDLFLRVNTQIGVKSSFKLFVRSARNYIVRKIGRNS
ncbi:MAG: hypothetical protein ACFE9C_18380, partial [Candidatus Hodarchaeota archaeon]